MFWNENRAWSEVNKIEVNCGHVLFDEHVVYIRAVSCFMTILSFTFTALDIKDKLIKHFGTFPALEKYARDAPDPELLSKIKVIFYLAFSGAYYFAPPKPGCLIEQNRTKNQSNSIERDLSFNFVWIRFCTNSTSWRQNLPPRSKHNDEPVLNESM